MFDILNTSLKIIVGILVIGHNSNKESAKLYGDLSLLFMGIGLTIWQLNYGTIFIVAIASFLIFIREKKNKMIFTQQKSSQHYHSYTK